MKILMFIANNWDLLLLCAAAVAALIFAVFRGNKGVVMKMLYALVTEAEKELGGGTGALKLAAVIERIYPKLPVVIKMFVTEKRLQKWIEAALVAAKNAWSTNPQIAAYVAVDKSLK